MNSPDEITCSKASILRRLVVPLMVQVAGGLVAFAIWDFDPNALNLLRFLAGWVILTCALDWSFSLRSRHNAKSAGTGSERNDHE